MESNESTKIRLGVVDLNPCLSCILCGGYYIDATTITECLHSFCRACIVRYLETSKYCPVCDVRVHKTSPLRCIRSDKTLQDIVYKLVPELYQSEMKGRRELYASQPPEALKESRDAEDRGEDLDKRFIYTADEIFNLTLQYSHRKLGTDSNDTDDTCDIKDSTCRYLRCPAAFRIFHLKKFIRLKYSIPQVLHISLQHQDEILDDDYSLMDVAYITSWKRMGPIQLTFSVHERPQRPPPPYFRVTTEVTSLTSTDTSTHQSTKQSNLEESPSNNEDHCGDDEVFNTQENISRNSSLEAADSQTVRSDRKKAKLSERSKKSNKRDVSTNSGTKERSRKSLHKSVQKHRRKRKISATIKKSSSTDLEAGDSSPPKVPKLTISLTPKILQIAAQHAEDDKMDTEDDSYESRLVISEPAESPKESDGYCSDREPSPKMVAFADLEEEDDRKKSVDDYEVDSGRGSDSSSRVENEDIGSPGSSSVLTPDLEKPDTFLLPSPLSLPSPTSSTSDEVRSVSKSVDSPLSPNIPKKDDLGVLDLSTCSRRNSTNDGGGCRSKQVANPPVLDKFRQTNPCLPIHLPPYKLLPTVYAHSNNFKKTDCSPGNYRYNKGNSFTVINPDPNSCRPKIVIKNLDPKHSPQKHQHHHHHHHHHHHNNQRS